MSECRSVEQCRGSVGAVSVDTGVGTGCRAVSEQCRSSVGAVSGALDVGHHRMASSSVGVSECRSVRVSECRVGLTQVGDSFKQ